MDQYIGRLLDDRYEILEIIGTGGMAVVYKARDHRLNRLVAVKILKDEFARDEEFRRRFRAEGEAVAMLSHPNIVQVYDVSASDSANYIVMELIDGISLKQYMEKKGVLNWKETLHFAMQIAKGLEHAHSRGIIHRDIKPHNVMVLKNGSVKVMDFGIARVMSKSNTLTKEALGSVHYISPEQAKGGHTDNRSDIYSLAVLNVPQAMLFGKIHQIIGYFLRIPGTVGNGADFLKIMKNRSRLQTRQSFRFHTDTPFHWMEFLTLILPQAPSKVYRNLSPENSKDYGKIRSPAHFYPSKRNFLSFCKSLLRSNSSLMSMVSSSFRASSKLPTALGSWASVSTTTKTPRSMHRGIIFR